MFDLLRQGQICFPNHLYGPYMYIYIGSIEVICRSTVAKLILIGNLRWPPSCLCLLYFPATMLVTCVKSWFFRNHWANFHQISHWSYCWNVIDSLFKWSRSIDCQAIFFFKTKNCSNDDLFISWMIGLEKCCITAYLQWLCHSGEWAVARGPLVSLTRNTLAKIFSRRHWNIFLIFPRKQDLTFHAIVSNADSLHEMSIVFSGEK